MARDTNSARAARTLIRYPEPTGSSRSLDTAGQRSWDAVPVEAEHSTTFCRVSGYEITDALSGRKLLDGETICSVML